MSASRSRRFFDRRRFALIFALSLIFTSMNGVFVTFAANPSATLDQCANDPAPSPSTDGCSASASDWVPGNLGASKANYFEGDSIPYRLTFDNLDLASHTVQIEWDTTKSGTHAIDYLTTFNRTVATANPCLGVASCPLGSPTTFPIPADPQVTGAGVTPVAGNFTLYGGTITAVSAYSYADGAGFAGDKSARITVTFTASQANPVLAWGGHIASRADWGLTSSAVSIPGSPYHTRLIDLDGSGGNQDRSLSAQAVVFPGSITIVKDATPNGATSFPFTASPSPLANFTLVDDGTSANTRLFSNVTVFQTYTVAETVPASWTLTGIVCAVTSPNGGTQPVTSPSVSIDLKEGENVTCTYSDQQQAAHLQLVKTVINDNGGTATAASWTTIATGPTPLSGAGGVASTAVTPGTYSLSETGSVAGYANGTTYSCVKNGGSAVVGNSITLADGDSAICTITNNDIAPKLHLRKLVTNNNGGTKTVSDFTLTADGAGTNDLSGTSPVDSGAGLLADTWALSETSVAGYSAGAWVCDGGTQNGSNITVGVGGEATCTITNDDIASSLTLAKTVTNDNGGTALATAWTLSASGPTPISGATGSAAVTNAAVNPGTYTLSESGGPGAYTASSWVCVGGTQNGNTITLANGQSATCTITNDDIAPKLHLRKVVVNDNGGTATLADFTLMANGTGTNDLSGTSPVDSGASLQADTWALSETSPGGYSASAWVCDGGTQEGSDITVGIGGEATCTITNDDQPGQLTFVKTADKPSVDAGESIGFIIAVANTGEGTAIAVTITDTLPTGTGLAWSIDAESSDSGCTITSGVLTCTFGDLAPDESRSVHVTSPTTVSQCPEPVSNEARVTTGNGSGDLTASASVVVNCHPDVSVTKTGNGPRTAGQAATFTITVNAAGTGPSSNVTLSDTLPAGTWTLGGADAESCTLAGSSLTCSFGSMDSGTSKTITLSRASTTGDCPTPIANTATVNATADANTENNTSTASISVTCPPPPQTPSLVVSKTADATLVTAGAQGTSNVGFTVTVTNNGFISTTAVLSDTPLVAAGPSTPAGNAGTLGLTWAVDAAGSDTGCSITSNTLSCNFGTLQPGASKHVHITAPVTGRTAAASRADNCGQRVDNMAIATMGNGASLQSNHATVDIACLPTTSAGSLTITKYGDNNANALKDSGESNLAGWTFEVKNNATGATRTATTDANGSVTVNDLESGTYTVTEKSCTSPCDLTKWKPISYVIGGQATVSSTSGTAQITIAAPEQSITFGNQPPLLPSTSTGDDNRDRIQTLVLLLLAALVAQVLVLRVVARILPREVS